MDCFVSVWYRCQPSKAPSRHLSTRDVSDDVNKRSQLGARVPAMDTDGTEVKSRSSKSSTQLTPPNGPSSAAASAKATPTPGSARATPTPGSARTTPQPGSAKATPTPSQAALRSGRGSLTPGRVASGVTHGSDIPVPEEGKTLESRFCRLPKNHMYGGQVAYLHSRTKQKQSSPYRVTVTKFSSN